MKHEPDMAKRQLRRLLVARYASCAEAELVDGKMGLFNTLWQSSIFDDGMRLLAYYPFRNEPDVRYFLRVWLSHGRDLFLTRMIVNSTGMEVWQIPDILAVTSGYRGILEPDIERCRLASHGDIDAVLVPGMAFQSDGARLGRGGGHYDRFLAGLGEQVLRIGIAYDWAILDGEAAFEQGHQIPMEEHDLRMHYVATPSRLYDCRQESVADD